VPNRLVDYLKPQLKEHLVLQIRGLASVMSILITMFCTLDHYHKI